MKIDTQYQSSNFWANNNPRSIMLHTTGGHGVLGAVETLLARGLSYNYIIDNGIIYQLVDWSNSAWHAGVVRGMNMRSQVFYGSGKGDENPNKHSVGIAFTYPTGVDLTLLADKDIDACTRLLKHIGKGAMVRYTADNIFYHQEVTSDKPIMVKGYRDQILDALVGDKDDKDTGEKDRLTLMIQFLMLKLKYLLLLKALRK